MNQLENEYEPLNKKLNYLNGDELKLVTGEEKCEDNLLEIKCPNCSNIQEAIRSDIYYNSDKLCTCNSCKKTFP